MQDRIEADPFCTIVASGNFVVQHYPGELDINIAGLERIGRVTAAIAAERGKFLSFTYAHTKKALRFPPDVRKKASDLRTGARHTNLAAATCLVGEGMGASIVRTFVATLMALGKSPYPERVFSDLDDAIAWLSNLHEAAGMPPEEMQRICALAEQEATRALASTTPLPAAAP